MQNKIKILNLIGDLHESFARYFEKLNAELIGRGEAENYEEIDHILVGTEEEAAEASKDFNTGENQISIIAIDYYHIRY